MKILSLKLLNFRQHADTEVSFPDGMVGVLGANGEGKSTLLEGIAFALYGSRAVRGTKGSLRWNRAPARHVAEATLRFEIGGSTYQVQRSEGDAKLYQVGRDLPIAEKTSGVDEAIPKLIGMPWEEWRATYMCAQKDLGNIAAMKGTARRTFFLGVMGVGRIVDALKQLREDKNLKRRERDGLQLGLGERAPREQEVSQAEAALEAAKAELAECTTVLAAAVKDRDVRAEALTASAAKAAEHDRLTRAHEDAVRDYHRATQDRAGVLENIQTAERHAARAAELEVKVADLPALRAQRDTLLAARHTATQRASLEKRQAEIAAEIARAEEMAADAERRISFFDPAELEKAEAAVASVDARLSALREARDKGYFTAIAARDAADVELTRQNRRIAAIREAGADGGCPTCFRPLAEHFDSVMVGLEADRDRFAAAVLEEAKKVREFSEESDEELVSGAEMDEVTAIRERCRALKSDAALATSNLARERAQIESLKKQGESVREQLSTLSPVVFDADALQDVEAAIFAHETLERELATARAHAARKPELEADAERHRVASDDAMGRRDRALAESAALAFDAEAHHGLEVDAGIAERAVNDARTRRERAEVSAEGAMGWRDRALAALAEYDERATRLHALEAELSVYAGAESRLDEFREAQASSIRPEMEELTSAFVAQLTDGRFEACTLNEDFEPVLQRGGMDMEVLSGGEEDVVAIAMRLAVSQMIAERAGHPLSLLILDEPFGSQDQVRQQNMVNLIRRLSDTFSQVLVISHVEEIKDSMDSTIVVRFDEASGRSVVTSGARALEAVA